MPQSPDVSRSNDPLTKALVDANIGKSPDGGRHNDVLAAAVYRLVGDLAKSPDKDLPEEDIRIIAQLLEDHPFIY